MKGAQGFPSPRARRFRSRVGPGRELHQGQALLYPGITNSGPRAKSGPLPVSLNKVLLEFTHALASTAENIHPEFVPIPAPDRQEEFGDEFRLCSKQTKMKQTATNGLSPSKKISFPKLQAGSCLTARMGCAGSQSSVLSGMVEGAATGKAHRGPAGCWRCSVS